MKVAFVSTILHYPWGGADTLWTHAAEAAQARGDRLFMAISHATAAHPRVRALRAGGAELFERHIPAPPGRLQRLGRKLSLIESDAEQPLINALLRFRPDLVVINQGGTYDLLILPGLLSALRTAGIPFRAIANWQQENPTLPSADVAVVRPLLEAADRLFFVSTRNLAVTRRHLLSPLPRASVVHNPLRWQPADSPSWPDAGPARLATVSRLDDGKGLHLLFHALAELGTSLPDWRVTVHGQGPAEGALREVVTHLGLGERIHFAGHVSSLRSLWAEQELLCSPALDEGVPMTIPEAMLCRRPVLATCVGGAEDWLQENDTGFLCPAPTVPLLVETLRRAFAARGRWRSMGELAGNRAEACYRPEDFRLLIS